MLLAKAGGSTTTGAETTTTAAPTDLIPDPGTAADRYPDGTEIIFLGPGGQQDFARAKAVEFYELTNCKVTVEEIAFADILDKVLVSLRTGAYIADVANIGSQFGGDFMGAGLVYEVPPWAQERSGYGDTLQVFVDLQLYWAGKPYARNPFHRPTAGELHLLMQAMQTPTIPMFAGALPALGGPRPAPPGRDPGRLP